MTTPSQNQHRAGHISPRYLTVTFIAAATASIAAGVSLALQLPIWAMFIGWIAFFSRGLDTRSAFENFGCVWLGLVIGALAATGIASLVPAMGLMIAMPAVVFVVALIVVSLRGLPPLNNLLGYFLGLVAWFAAHLEPSVAAVGQLAGASAIGSLAGWISHHLPRRMSAS
ncbi:DUF1097 domain-containing protein [Pectobacterium cacticida]|uniref:DUF1097 domain-containing protein n=1 Tax=Pectobacterium cacticida TaxID=69221 RepID=A0ABZ2GBY4_9GAMM|nr:DUF1097 domain-containing protein [Pectobacterium cacticida]UYX06914.1 DUF1097 domain-containing protein [Pectobacterium cacticida]